MKVVAILGIDGIGSKMIKYSFMLWLEEQGIECMMDTSEQMVLGYSEEYQLDRIFGIVHNDVVDEYSDEEKKMISDGIISPWDACFKHYNLYKGEGVRYYAGKAYVYGGSGRLKNNSYTRLKNVISYIQRHYIKQRIRPGDSYKKSFFIDDRLCWVDDFEHISDKYLFKNKKELKRIFRFPNFSDCIDSEVSENMLNEESVALHVRRGDHMYDQSSLFKRKYFKKAMDYIHSKAGKRLCIYLFSDDMDWCRNHLSELGIMCTDKCVIVDWHSGTQSYRDMQLMTYCKHNILSKSTFSYWGYYINKWDYSKKIVIAPKGFWLEVDVHL